MGCHSLVQGAGRPVATLELLAGAAWAWVVAARISRLAELAQSLLRGAVGFIDLADPARRRLGRQDFAGAKPADLRVEQPTKFDLVVNLIVAMEVP